MYDLVIVESAAKTKTISKILGPGFVVVASLGHIRELGEGNGVDNDFTPTYVNIPGKASTINSIKKKAREAKMVWLASDPDREGEVIAHHLKQVLNLKEYHRISFSEITKKAVENAMKSPRKIDEFLVEAQETRRLLDRIVGFNLSPCLWKKFKEQKGLSAGRVQSAVLNLITLREKSIQAFSKSSYWTVDASYKTRFGPLKASLYDEQGLKKIASEEESLKILQTYIQHDRREVVKTRVTKKPDPPFITSSLQMEAYQTLKLPLKRTMQLAQDLYEGGLITYMRTDSYALSTDFIKHASAYILETYGKEYVGDSIKNKSNPKNSQEAHECIRVTDVSRKVVNLSTDHNNLYKMIWKRSIACCMSASLWDELTVTVFYPNLKSQFFKGIIRSLYFDGFLKIYESVREKIIFTDIDNLNLECESMRASQVFPHPPKRFNDSSLIKLMESEGIGRPSTYSSIVSKLYEKNYITICTDAGEKIKSKTHTLNVRRKVIKSDFEDVIVGKNHGISPTQIGKSVDSFLNEHFDYIVCKQFTSCMENDLDKITRGEKHGKEMLRSLWSKLKSDIDRANNSIIVPFLKNKETYFEIDGLKYIIKNARYGPVIQYNKKFIGLQPFLDFKKKTISEVSSDDVKKIINLQERGVFLGRYGFYSKKHDDIVVKKMVNDLFNA